MNPLKNLVAYTTQTLKRFIFTATLIVSGVTFLIVLSTLFWIFLKQSNEVSTRNSTEMATQILISVTNAMGEGSNLKELNEIVLRYQRSFNGRYTITLLPNNTLTKSSYAHPEPKKESPIGGGYSNLDITFSRTLDTIKHVFPVKAESKCLSCHPDVKLGEIMGVLSVTEDIRSIRNDFLRRFLYFFLLFIPFPLLMSYLASRFVNIHLGEALSILDQKVRSINSVKDLAKLQLDIDSKEIKFRELRDIFTDINDIATKIKGVAVDKEILKLAEESLKESRHFLDRILNSTPNMIYIYDLVEHRNVYVNRSVTDFLGYSCQQVQDMGSSLFDNILHPDDAALVASHHATLASTCDGEVRTLEYRMRHYNGEWRWLNSRDILFSRDETGAARQILGSTEDITNRKQAADNLRQSYEQLQFVLEGSQLGFWDWNMETGKVVRNERWAEMLGYTLREIDLTTNQWEDLIHPDDRERAWRSINDHLCGLTPLHEIEYRMLTKDGQFKWILDRSKIVKYDADGKPARMCGTHTDISGRKRAEEETYALEQNLLQSQKMETVGRLAGGVAHDFNNMLGVILGHSELALMKLDPTQPVYASLTQIRIAAERSADLTRQLLAFARKQTIAPKVINLNVNITGMLTMLKRLIGENINLNWHPASNLWPVKVDPSQIDQMLANLCINARDAITVVGKITIETENCSLDTAGCATHAFVQPGEYLRLAVSDDGIGMDKETQAQIFEPFFTTKGIGKGTGLGLATVYGIVEQNNGFIEVCSEPGHGTTFNIYLPRHIGAEGEIFKEVETELVPRGNETILLVEDEPGILESTAMLLEGLGYTVLMAGSADEAIRLFKEQTGKIHMLMSDVVMPDMNGRDLVKVLLSLNPQLKCLFMSGYTSNIIAHNGVLDEDVHFIQKPFLLPGLATKVREVLGGKYRCE